jgi:hypothetical protein
MFQLNFEDDRYLPFEGGGAISTWRIQLPDPTIKQFDYNSISDTIMHISYTAKDGGETFSGEVIKKTQDLINDMITYEESKGLYKVISLKHDFPSDFYKMQNSDTGNYPLKITKSMFPFFVRSKTITSTAISFFDENGAAFDSSVISSSNAGETIGEEWELDLLYAKDKLSDDVLVLINYTIA